MTNRGDAGKVELPSTAEQKVVRGGEFKVLDTSTGEFEALVGVTNVVDDTNDIIMPGAYKKTLGERMPRVCWGHDWKQSVGVVTQAEEWFPGDPRLPQNYQNENAGALWVRGKFNLKTARGLEAYEEVKFLEDHDQHSEWSIGYEVEASGKTAKRKDGAREITELGALFEVSPVLWGAAGLGRTMTLAVKSGELTDDRAKTLIKEAIEEARKNWASFDAQRAHGGGHHASGRSPKGGHPGRVGHGHAKPGAHLTPKPKGAHAGHKTPPATSAPAQSTSPTAGKTSEVTVSVKSFPPVESKANCAIQGSYEARQAALEDAVDRWLSEMLPAMTTYSWVEATFDEYAVVGVGYYDDSEDDHGVEYWKLPYQVEPDGCVTLGHPSAVEVQGVVVDMPTDGAEVEMLPAEKVIARSVSFKNATRMRRRLLLWQWMGMDVSATGVDPESWAGIGGGSIPDGDTDPDYLDHVEGGNLNQGVGSAIPVDQSYLDNVTGNDLPNVNWKPEMLSGTWYYVDGHNAGLQTPGVDGGYTAPGHHSSLTTPRLVPAGTYYNDHAGSIPTPTGYAEAAGHTATLSADEGETKNATRLRRRARLLGQLHGTFYSAAPGAGGYGSSPHTMSPATPSLSTPAVSAALSANDQAMAKAAELLVAIKEGRVLSGGNAARVRQAHAALTEILAQVGGESDPDREPDANTVSGYDEDGQPIEVTRAKSKADAEAKSFEFDMMQWESLRTTPLDLID